MNVLISGASIAGPALAYWLSRYGCAVTVVEKAPSLRTGGQAVDFKGATHRTVLERMGIWDEVRRRQTGGTDHAIVDADGRTLAVMPGEFTGGDVEIRRGDLAEILYSRTRETCEYIFGDSITSLTEAADAVQVTFERGAPRSFDVVVGADGIHSNVRRLAFGPEEDYVRFLGHYYALAELDGDWEPMMYNEPGRMVTTGGHKSPAFFVFASPPLDAPDPKKVIMDAYAGAAWRTPEILAAVADSPDVYLDSISQVRIDRYSSGRVVLLGDAAYGNTLAGFGTGLAIVGAYVLAGELADGDYAAAFRRYEEIFRPYAKIARNGNAGPFMAPGSPMKIRMRNWMFQRRLLMWTMLKVTDWFATDIDLPRYVRLP